jgi:ABC-type antimicrobial peptide transport system permease subunit
VRVRDARATAAILRAIGPSAFVDEVRTIDQVMDRLVRRDRTFAMITALFAAVAVLLACIGIYGVVAFRAARRTAEIGIRVALGATRGDVLWLIARDSAVLIAAGAVAGVPCAIAAAGGLRSMLFGVRPSDPFALGAAVVVLALTGLGASIVPARRAALVSPSEALRCD